MSDSERHVELLAQPLLAAAHLTLRFDDIFQPDTLTWMETEKERRWDPAY